jgi:erythromycin esterase
VPISKRGIVLLLSLVFGGVTTLRADSSEQQQFLKWAKSAAIPLAASSAPEQLHDLDALGEMIGDATVVAVSEGVHAGAEPLEFRNRLFQYLVQRKGFTAIAIESGIVESRAVHDYVLGARGELGAALSNGLSWTFDRLPQNEALVRWVAEYNARPEVTRKLNFYGFDVPGSPGNPMANRGTDVALLEVLAYLDRVDSPAAAAFRSRLGGLLSRVRFDPVRADSPSYHTLTSSERDTITAVVADLVALIERKEAVYVAASSASDYEWAHRAAIGARQVDGWLRHIPLGWQPSTVRESWFSPATDVRDRGQADNVDWVVRQEGAGGKILLFAARYHLSMASLVARSPEPGSAAGSRQEVAGTYLHRRFGSHLFTIGNLISRGSIGCAGFSMTLPTASSETLDGLASHLDMPRFLLDLRRAPPAVSTWLNLERPLGLDLSMPVGRAYDALVYFDAVRPACDEASSARK